MKNKTPTALRLALVAGLSGFMGTAANAQVCTGTTTNFGFTGALDTYTVPAGVTSANIIVRGAAGGTAPGSTFAGGLGAEVSGDFPVTPGAVLTILVGGSGGTTNGGGGGSFVTDSSNTPIAIAGGGGGSGNGDDSPTKDGQAGTAGAAGTGGGSSGGLLGQRIRVLLANAV